MRAAVALRPATPVAAVEPLLDAVDMVLVMTVEPGFGGQALIPACLDKVRRLRELRPALDIQVDGGVTLENLPSVARAGANVIVAGSLIFGHAQPARLIGEMRRIMNSPE